MADYVSFKVPELKKLLTDRGLTVAGNKADLIARLQENDAASKGPKGNEDEIDWDDDKPAAAPAVALPGMEAAAPPAPEAAADKPIEVPTTAAPSDGATEETVTGDTKDGDESVKPAEADPTQDIAPIDLAEELRRRDARAKRFGIVPGAQNGEGGDDEKKLAERAARFGLDTASDIKDSILKSLDTALPDRPLKRGRGGDGVGGDRRDNKRNANDRRQGGGGRFNNNSNNSRNRNNNNRDHNDRRGNDRRGNGGGGRDSGVQKQKKSSFLDDPTERKKAEDRAKRFGL